MATKYCAKCGREVAAGKSFCGGCGQAMPIAAASAQPEPVIAPGSAPRSCAQCGAALTPGKRFCKQCGKAVDEPPPVAKPEPSVVAQEVASPTVRTCVGCGAFLDPGKRFCKRCGQAVDSTASDAQIKAVPSGLGNSPPEQLPAFDSPSAATVAASAEELVPAQDQRANHPGSNASTDEPKAEPHAQAEPTTFPTFAWGQEEPDFLPPSTLSANADTDSLASPEPLQLPASAVKGEGGTSNRHCYSSGVDGWRYSGWHWYSHRSESSSATVPSELQQTVVAPSAQNQNPEPAVAPEQPSKPLPGTSGNPASNAPRRQSGSGTATLPYSPPTNAPEDSTRHQGAVTPQPAITPPPPSPPAATPVAPRSGVLHYQGPPVPHNGVVVFDHLPQARLKFTFDHQAWSLTIKANPDGTKKITMISQAPGFQTTCDLGWENVE